MTKKFVCLLAFALLCLGIPGKAWAAKPKPATAGTAFPRQYQIVRGDTLSAIALANYGRADEVAYDFLAEANEIKDPNLIYTGSVITVPAFAPEKALAAKVAYAHAERLQLQAAAETTNAPATIAPIQKLASSWSPAPISIAQPVMAADMPVVVPAAPAVSLAQSDDVAASLLAGMPTIAALPPPPVVETTAKLQSQPARKKAARQSYEVKLELAPDDTVAVGSFKGILFQTDSDNNKKLSGRVAVIVTPTGKNFLMDVVLKKRPAKGEQLAIGFPAGTEVISSAYMEAGATSTSEVLKVASNKAYQPFVAALGIQQRHIMRTMASVSLFAGRSALGFTAGPIVGGIALGSSVTSLIVSRHIASLKRQHAALEAHSVALSSGH